MLYAVFSSSNRASSSSYRASGTVGTPCVLRFAIPISSDGITIISIVRSPIGSMPDAALPSAQPVLLHSVLVPFLQ